MAIQTISTLALPILGCPNLGGSARCHSLKTISGYFLIYFLTFLIAYLVFIYYLHLLTYLLLMFETPFRKPGLWDFLRGVPLRQTMLTAVKRAPVSAAGFCY